MFLDHISEEEMGTQLALEEYSSESITSLLPIIRVTEDGDKIRVQGMRSFLFEDAVKNHWNTGKIYNNILTNDGYMFLEFKKWFAVEFAYILTKLIEAGGYRVAVSDLKTCLRKLYDNTWLGSTRDTKPLDFNYNKLSELNVTLFDYQMAYLKSYQENVPKYNLRGYLAEAEAGSGKTLQGYAFSLVTESDLTIFLVPKPTVQQIWVGTAEKFFKRPKRVWNSVDGGTITGKEDYLIVHHHVSPMQFVLDHASKIRRAGKITIWIDESHKFTTDSAKTVQLLYEMVKTFNPEHIVHASATPLKAEPKEAVPLLKTIDPMFDRHVEKHYLKTYGSSKPVALDILNHRLGLVKFKVTKEQYSKIKEEEIELKVKFDGMERYTLDNVRREMQEKAKEYVAQYEEVKSEIISQYRMYFEEAKVKSNEDEKKTLKTYRQMADEMHKGFHMQSHLQYIRDCKKIEEEIILPKLEREGRREFKALAPLYKYPILSIRGRLLGNVLGRMRIECFTEMAKSMDFNNLHEASVKKLLVFASNVEPVKAAAARAEEQGFEPLIVSQETNKDLPSILKRAESDPKANPVCATYMSLGTGNELVMCSTAIFIDQPFRSITLHQAKFRINRASQDTDVKYVTMVLDTGEEQNLSTRNLDILSWSKDMVDRMLGVEGNEIDGSEIDDDIVGLK